MTITYYPELEQGSDEWLAARCGIVTASVVGKLITVSAPGPIEYDCPDCGAAAGDPCVSKASKAATPIKTMHGARSAEAERNAATAPPILSVADNDTARGIIVSLTAEWITKHVDEVRITDAMWRGRIEEPLARQAYADYYNPVTEVGFVTRDDWGYPIGYSPDGLVGDDGLIEIKSRNQKQQLLTILAGEVPAECMGQLQCGLLVTDRSWIDYVSYSSGMPLWKKRVYPDPRWFAAIQSAIKTYEEAASDMRIRYEAAVEGLPVMPITPDPFDVELKL